MYRRAHSHPHDLGVAAGAGGSEELLVAVLAVDAVLFLHEADVSQRRVTVVTVELLGVPRPAQRHQEGAPGYDHDHDHRLSGHFIHHLISTDAERTLATTAILEVQSVQL